MLSKVVTFLFTKTFIIKTTFTGALLSIRRRFKNVFYVASSWAKRTRATDNATSKRTVHKMLKTQGNCIYYAAVLISRITKLAHPHAREFDCLSHKAPNSNTKMHRKAKTWTRTEVISVPLFSSKDKRSKSTNIKTLPSKTTRIMRQ